MWKEVLRGHFIRMMLRSKAAYLTIQTLGNLLGFSSPTAFSFSIALDRTLYFNIYCYVWDAF